MDLFAKKIQENVSIKTAFPEYDGPHTEEACYEYIREKFQGIVSNINFERQFYVHPTTAIDKNKLLVVWDSLSQIILRNAIESAF